MIKIHISFLKLLFLIISYQSTILCKCDRNSELFQKSEKINQSALIEGNISSNIGL